MEWVSLFSNACLCQSANLLICQIAIETIDPWLRLARSTNRWTAATMTPPGIPESDALPDPRQPTNLRYNPALIGPCWGLLYRMAWKPTRYVASSYSGWALLLQDPFLKLSLVTYKVWCDPPAWPSTLYMPRWSWWYKATQLYRSPGW